jgi:hypothetical protein
MFSSISALAYFFLCFSEAVRANRMTKSASNAESEAIIKEWLRTSADRSGGRSARERKRPRITPDARHETDNSANEEDME